jgi:type III secretory pathway component EscT
VSGPEVLLGPFALVAVRVFAIVRMQPLWSAALGAAWIPVAAALAGVLGIVVVTDPGFVAPADASLVVWVGLGVLELVLGTVIGALASLPGHALLGAAGASAQLLRTAPRPFVGLTVGISLTAGLTAGLHRPLIEVLTDSFRWLPAGVPSPWLSTPPVDLLGLLLAALDGLLVLGLALVTPALLTTAVARFGVAAMARGPSPSHALSGAFDAWLGVALALVALGASWAVYPHAWARAMLPPLG